MRVRKCLLVAVALHLLHHTSPSRAQLLVRHSSSLPSARRCAGPVLHQHITHDDRASHVQLWAQRPCDAAPVALSEVDIRVTAGHLTVTGAAASTPFRQRYALADAAGTCVRST